MTSFFIALTRFRIYILILAKQKKVKKKNSYRDEKIEITKNDDNK